MARKIQKPKAKAKRAPVQAVEAAPDAIKLLKADHAKVGKLFAQYEEGVGRLTDEQKKFIAVQICDELTVHATIEEEIFYPAIEARVGGAEDLLAEAYVEHTSLKRLISDIEAGEPGTDEYDANIKVLGEYTHHHVEEEHTELFPKVRRSKIDLAELGEKMLQRKAQLTAQNKSSPSPENSDTHQQPAA